MKVKEFMKLYDDVILFSLKEKIIGDNCAYGIFGLENDVDEYIKSLELQLKQMIKEDKEIQIID